MRVAIVLALVAAGTAAADTLAGTYDLKDAGIGSLSVDGNAVPRCNRIRADLRGAILRYDGKGQVGSPLWRFVALTGGRVNVELRVPIANTEVELVFEERRGDATGMVTWIERDPRGVAICGDGLRGTFTPPP